MVGFAAPGQVPPGIAVPFSAVGGGPDAELPPSDRLGKYHVLLDGQGYLIDPTTYRRRPAARFAPKTRTGEEGYGDFVNGSAWSQSSWGEGFGFEEWDKAHNVQLADNLGVDTSRGDMRPGRPSVVQAAAGGIWQFATYNGFLYGIDGDSPSVFRFSPSGGWASSSMAAISPCTSLRSIAVSSHGGAQTYLFVGASDSGKIFRFDGTTWILWATVTGSTGIHALANQPATPTGAPSFGVIPGRLLIGASQVIDVGGGATGFSATTCALVSFDYGGTIPIMVAPSRHPYFAAIYARWTDGALFWSVGDTTLVESVLHLANGKEVLIADNIITCFIDYGEKLLAGTHTRGRIYEVQADKIVEWFHIPEIARPGTPPLYQQPMRQMVLTDDRLYVPFLDVQGLCAYQFDGQGWGRINVPIAGSTSPRGLGFYDNCLYLAWDAGTYRLLPQYTTGGVAITPWFDADLGTLDKGFMRVTLAHSVLQTGETIAVAFAVDDNATFTALGTASVVGLSTSTFTFPSGVHGKRLRLRFTFTLTNNLHGQRLRSFIVEYNLTSDVVVGNPTGEPPTDAHVKGEFAFEVLLEGTFEHPLVRLDRSVEPKTGDALRRALWATKAKQSAVAYEDVDGQQYSLWFSDLEDRLVKEHASPQQGWRGTVRLTEE